MEDNQQAVANNADDLPKGGAEAGGAQDLDSLLREFDDEPTKQSAADTGKTEELTKNDIKEIADFVKTERERRLQEETRKSIDSVIKNIKGESKVPDDLVEGLLYANASKNPALTRAFQQRDKNPEAWAKVEKELSRKLMSVLDGLSARSDEGKKRVVDAVRSAKSATASDTAPDFSKMSAGEYNAYKAKLFQGSDG